LYTSSLCSLAFAKEEKAVKHASTRTKERIIFRTKINPPFPLRISRFFQTMSPLWDEKFLLNAKIFLHKKRLTTHVKHNGIPHLYIQSKSVCFVVNIMI